MLGDHGFGEIRCLQILFPSVFGNHLVHLFRQSFDYDFAHAISPVVARLSVSRPWRNAASNSMSYGLSRVESQPLPLNPKQESGGGFTWNPAFAGLTMTFVPPLEIS
jgi:hypothetical protein